MIGHRMAGPAGNSGDARLVRRVRLRLVAWSGGISLVILVALGVAVYATTALSLGASTTARLQQLALELSDVVRQGPPDLLRGEVPGVLPIGPAFGGAASETLALIVRPDGVILGLDVTLPGIPVQAGVEAALRGATDVREAQVGDTPVRVLSEPVARNGDTYVVQILGDRTGETRTLDTLLLVLLVGGLGALALAFLGGWFYAERALVPIRESLVRQREFAADASHELRTPLAVVRGSLEHLERHADETVASVGTALDDIGVEVGHLTDLVDSLLLLARADSGAIEIEQLPVDLADVAMGALGGLATVAAARSVRIEIDATPAEVVGDPVRLRQLVTILADNAIRHSPEGGTVRVHVAHEGEARDRRRVGLVVDDEGPGLDPGHRARVFDRFWRAPGAAPGGTGLGLSIAAWIVERHGGEIAAESAPTGGARFRVSLPARGA